MDSQSQGNVTATQVLFTRIDTRLLSAKIPEVQQFRQRAVLDVQSAQSGMPLWITQLADHEDAHEFSIRLLEEATGPTFIELPFRWRRWGKWL